MSELFNITHDGGDLSEYDGTVTDGGDLSAEVAAALAGTVEGLQLVIDDSNSIYGYVTGLASSTGRTRHRFYLDPHGLTMAELDVFNILILLNSTPAWIALVKLVYKDSAYKIRVTVYNDAAGTHDTSDYVISDAEHYVEIDLIRAATDVSADGSLQLWIDGASKETISGVDNYDRFDDFNLAQFGAPYGLDAGTSGTFYLDEWVANDDGSEIGSAQLPAPRALYHYRRRRRVA